MIVRACVCERLCVRVRRACVCVYQLRELSANTEYTNSIHHKLADTFSVLSFVTIKFMLSV